MDHLNRTHIAVVNQCQQANLTHDQVAAMVAAVHEQAREFAHAWGILAPTVSHLNPTIIPPTVDTVIAILDNADQAGALGYHDETVQGVTYGRVFALDCDHAGVSVSSCLSHEVLEALADLNVDRWVQAPDGTEYALEVCDPCESDVYTENGVELSDYVLPSWFDDAGLAPFDRLGKITAPFALAKGGYAIVKHGSQVSQVWGDRDYYAEHEGWRDATKTSPLSRTARRLS